MLKCEKCGQGFSRARYLRIGRAAIHLNETAPTVGLLLHKTDSDPQKLPALTHFHRLRLVFPAEVSGILVALWSMFAEKALGALAVEPTVHAAKRNGDHNNENLFDLFARRCALCR